MAYKTVLVHCNDTRRIARVAEAAGARWPIGSRRTSSAFRSRRRSRSSPPGMPGAPDAIVLDEHCVAYRRDNPALRAAFEAAARGRSELRNGGKPTPAAPPSPMSSCSTPARPILWLRRRATRAGRDPLSRHRRSPGGRERPPGPDRPQEGLHKDSGKRISRCLERPPRGRPRGVRRAAAAAAGPEVKVVWVNPQDEGGAGRGRAGRRHLRGPGAARREMRGDRGRRPQTSVGRTLLMRAAEHGSDLLVMGCYGHSRLREFVLGGASRHVLDHMTHPSPDVALRNGRDRQHRFRSHRRPASQTQATPDMPTIGQRPVVRLRRVAATAERF